MCALRLPDSCPGSPAETGTGTGTEAGVPFTLALALVLALALAFTLLPRLLSFSSAWSFFPVSRVLTQNHIRN